MAREEARDPNEKEIDFKGWVLAIASTIWPGPDEIGDFDLESMVNQIKRLKQRPNLTKEEAAAVLCEHVPCNRCLNYGKNDAGGCAELLKSAEDKLRVYVEEEAEK